MSNHNYEENDYDSESDCALHSEIYALVEPAFVSPPRNQPGDDVADLEPSSLAAEVDSSESDDDFEFFRQIKEKYQVGCSERLASPKSGVMIQSANSDPDDDEDFEVLRAIKTRFRQYSVRGVNDGGSEEAGDAQGKNILTSHVVEGENRNSLNDKKVKYVFAFIEAIKKNRSAQNFIRNKMMRVQARMEELKRIIRRVRVVQIFDVQGRKQIELKKDRDLEQFISIRSNDQNVKGALKYGPQENLRVVNYRMAFQMYPQWIPRLKWKMEDCMQLKTGVVQQFHMSMLSKVIDLAIHHEGSEASTSADGILPMIGGVEVNPQALKEFLPNIDWDELASTYLPRRSGLQCQSRWINHEDPLINREQWVREEDKAILTYVRQKGHNWVAIADALGTNRTPFDCLARYQRSLNPNMIKSGWTPAEDAELTAAVQKYGESNWTVVSAALEGRTGPQCSNRWLKSLLPSKQKKGKWEPHEDTRLQIAVKLMGKCWNEIAKFIPGRTQASCRDRWVNCLDPSLNRSKWTTDEDDKLKEAIKAHGYSWAKVASCVPPRTDSQCRRRWATLFPGEVVKLRNAKKLRKALLPSNFVDRESYRPTLEENDVKGLALETGMAEVVNFDSVFYIFPKKPRSKRTHKRRVRFPELPIIRDQRSPRKRGRPKGARDKQSKDGEYELTLAEFKKTLKKGRRKLKNGSLASGSRSSAQDDELVSSAGQLEEERPKKRRRNTDERKASGGKTKDCSM